MPDDLDTVQERLKRKREYNDEKVKGLAEQQGMIGGGIGLLLGGFAALIIALAGGPVGFIAFAVVAGILFGGGAGYAFGKIQEGQDKAGFGKGDVVHAEGQALSMQEREQTLNVTYNGPGQSQGGQNWADTLTKPSSSQQHGRS
ncbi:MAG: hypothetical protein AAF195_02565 [Pseudomonadota bacterium]